jgi:hypothetical protein
MTMRALLAGVMLLAASPLSAGNRLAVRVSPAVCFSPANLIVRTTVESDAGNRALEVSAESDNFYRSSQIQLDGDKAPRVTQVYFRDLPPGSYDVTVDLMGADGRSRARAHQMVEVIAGASGR